MSIKTTYYGWSEGDFWFLSPYPRAMNKGKNRYASKEAAIKAANSRTDALKSAIVWEN